MYCCLSTVSECKELEGKLPQRVYDEVLRGLAVLEPNESGRFSLIADTMEDLLQARKMFDDSKHFCEWSSKLGNSGYCSALYLLSNELSVMLYIPIALASADIIENMD